jgi:hypothetical protein
MLTDRSALTQSLNTSFYYFSSDMTDTTPEQINGMKFEYWTDRTFETVQEFKDVIEPRKGKDKD